MFPEKLQFSSGKAVSKAAMPTLTDGFQAPAEHTQTVPLAKTGVNVGTKQETDPSQAY